MTAPHPEAALSARSRLISAIESAASELRHYHADPVADTLTSAADDYLSTAHTATAGDGGEHEPMTSTDAVRLWEIEQSALAQAPAVQAPAEEDIVLPAIGDGASAAQQEAYRRKHFPGATPTDAQPKPARPVGDEALREALKGVLFEYDRNTCAHEETHRCGFLWTICDQCGLKWADDEGGFQPYVDLPAVARAREILCEPVTALSVHPTTGQETVATPRDGGVREALNRVNARAEADSYEFRADEGDYTPTEHERAMLEDFGNGLIARVEEEFAALSAPGSAGPGEKLTEDRLREIARDLHWYVREGTSVPKLDGGWRHPFTVTADSRDLCDLVNRLATPSPAQEPGTGDTGEAR